MEELQIYFLAITHILINYAVIIFVKFEIEKMVSRFRIFMSLDAYLGLPIFSRSRYLL